MPLAPWQVSAATLPGIDDHFWDWLLWLSAKQEAGQHGLVATELAKLHEHLLDPFRRDHLAGAGSPRPSPATWPRGNWERRLGCQVSRAAQHAASPALL